MKKTLVFLLILSLLALSLAACGKVPKIQSEVWRLYSISKNGEAITLNGELIAEGGTLTFSDTTNGSAYIGTYTDKEKYSPTANTYDITMEGSKGKALVGIGENAKGEPVNTLTLFIGDYTLLFVASEKEK